MAGRTELRLWDPHADPGKPAGQLSLGEVGNVDEVKADSEAVDERTVEEVDDEPSVLKHVVTTGRSGAKVGVGCGAGGDETE